MLGVNHAITSAAVHPSGWIAARCSALATSDPSVTSGGSTYPSSLVCANPTSAAAWAAREVTGSSWAELVANTLAAVSKRLRTAAEFGVPDPVLGTTMKPGLDPSQWRSTAAVVEDLAAKAIQALEADKCRAAKLWREILGENDRGQILRLPPGCNANGLPMVDAAPVTAVGSDSARGFASR